MKQIFYCPKCNSIDENFRFKSNQEERDLTTWVNPRDGYGMMIRHIICPHCGNILSGIMLTRTGDGNEVDYIKSIIDEYNKETKDGGYISDGQLEKLINTIKKNKKID